MIQHSRKGMWDVIIVGGGPAGLWCARLLALLGYRVAVIAAKIGHKVCGDIQLLDGLNILAEAGLYQRYATGAFMMTHMELFSPNRTMFPVPVEAAAMPRHHFDRMLAAAAIDAGACMNPIDSDGASHVPGEVKKVVPQSDGVAITASFDGTKTPVTLRSRFAVLATGANAFLVHQLQMVASPRPTAVAKRQYIDSGADLRYTCIDYGKYVLPGYAWIIPVSRNNDGSTRYNVGCGVIGHQGAGRRITMAYREFLERFPPAREVADKATNMTPMEAAPLRCGLDGLLTPVRDRIVAIGETIGTTYHLSGEGVGPALETAQVAARTLHQALQHDCPAVLDHYASYIWSLRDRYAAYARYQNYFRHPWLVNYVARRAQRSRFLQQRAKQMMEGSASPVTALGWPQIALSYVADRVPRLFDQTAQLAERR